MDLLQEENNQESRGKQCSPHHSIHVDKFQGSFIIAANGDMIKMQFIG